jgi:hypothetical protein
VELRERKGAETLPSSVLLLLLLLATVAVVVVSQVAFLRGLRARDDEATPSQWNAIQGALMCSGDAAIRQLAASLASA